MEEQGPGSPLPWLWSSFCCCDLLWRDTLGEGKGESGGPGEGARGAPIEEREEPEGCLRRLLQQHQFNKLVNEQSCYEVSNGLQIELGPDYVINNFAMQCKLMPDKHIV